MNHLHSPLATRLLGVAVATFALITPALASAQGVPSYASGATDQQIRGTITAINDTWNISVADVNGYTDSVELHQGTIINPTGLTLEPGMTVTIDGTANGPNFDAMEIDTPYTYSGPPPVAVYYGPGTWSPGFAYGYGPSFSLYFNAGSNRFEQRPFVRDGTAFAPSRGARADVSPQRRFTEQQRTFEQPQQRSYGEPQQRSFAQPQQRTFAQPQQRTFSQPHVAPAPRGSYDGGSHHR
jgi:hypothetical protein